MPKLGDFEIIYLRSILTCYVKQLVLKLWLLSGRDKIRFFPMSLTCPQILLAQQETRLPNYKSLGRDQLELVRRLILVHHLVELTINCQIYNK